MHLRMEFDSGVGPTCFNYNGSPKNKRMGIQVVGMHLHYQASSTWMVFSKILAVRVIIIDVQEISDKIYVIVRPIVFPY